MTPSIARSVTTSLRRLGASGAPGAALSAIAITVAAASSAGVGLSLSNGISAATLVQAVLAAGVAAGAGLAVHAFVGRARAGRNNDVFATLIESVRDAVIRFEPDGSVGFLSRSAETLFGCRRYEIGGSGLFDRVHVADRPAYMTALSAANRDGQRATIEVRVRRDGDNAGFFWVEACLSAVPAPTGPYEVVAVLRDISKRRAAEEELERARIAAEDASEAKSRFLATIGHELRTPLNAIVGFSDMMEAGIGGTLSDGHKEYAGLIKQSGHHLLEIINMLLDMSKIEAGKFEIATERFAPDALADPCLQLVRKAASDRGIALRLEIADGLPMLRADERACRQILINLLSNAVKFSRDGGTVTLAIRRKGASIAMVVSDNGIGMGPQTVARLGEPFYQAQNGLARRYEGTGLGFSIVKGLVGLHGGKIDIASRSGEGTTITVSLPISGPGAAPASADIEPLRIEPASLGEQAWPENQQKSAAG